MSIAYEVNSLYVFQGRLDVYKRGYGGLDNNGAGLMLAMGVPLAIFAWEGSKHWVRWAFAAALPLLLHAVLMTYSRGAMLSLIVTTPFLLFRTRRRLQFGLLFAGLLMIIPTMAGPEIRARFFTLNEVEQDESANSRFGSWQAAFRIANDYPLLGVGIRNSPRFSYQYGADMPGRVIHSQYLQILADSRLSRADPLHRVDRDDAAREHEGAVAIARPDRRGGARRRHHPERRRRLDCGVRLRGRVPLARSVRAALSGGADRRADLRDSCSSARHCAAPAAIPSRPGVPRPGTEPVRRAGWRGQHRPRPACRGQVAVRIFTTWLPISRTQRQARPSA